MSAVSWELYGNIHTSGLTVAVTQCTGRSPKQ